MEIAENFSLEDELPFLVRKNIDIYYETLEGGSHWLTLVNGFTRSLTDFRAMGKELSRQGFSILSLDNRGAGSSTLDKPFSLREAEDDIVALWDHLKIPKSDLLGISFGGSLAMGVAARYPNRVRGLVLVSTAATESEVHPGDPPSDKTPEAALQYLSHYLSKAFIDSHKVLVNSLAKDTAKALTDGALRVGARVQREAMRGFDRRGQLKSIHSPTLIVHGTEDRVTEFFSAKYLRAEIPGSELMPFEGAGHLLLAESPKRLYQVTADFLKTLS